MRTITWSPTRALAGRLRGHEAIAPTFIRSDLSELASSSDWSLRDRATQPCRLDQKVLDFRSRSVVLLSRRFPAVPDALEQSTLALGLVLGGVA
jgi:hypothetical protein